MEPSEEEYARALEIVRKRSLFRRYPVLRPLLSAGIPGLFGFLLVDAMKSDPPYWELLLFLVVFAACYASIWLSRNVFTQEFEDRAYREEVLEKARHA